MMSMTEAYSRGFASGKRAGTGLTEKMKATYEGWRGEYPHVDIAEEILKLDGERMANPPSLAKFPATRGWPDLVVAERKGFADATGCGPPELAFRFTSFYFLVYRLCTRHIGGAANAAASPVTTDNCTAVFMRESKEGGPLYGRNVDGGYNKNIDIQPPRRGPDGKRRVWWKGVSCWAFCDEEPEEIFPVNAWQMLPDDCRKLPEVTEFARHHGDFWYACNGVLVDEDLDSVAFEKSARRLAWRYSDDGTAAVTSCAQVIPEMHAHREKCLQKSLELRDFHDENLPDRKYWNTAEARYRRLLRLVGEAAKRGPTLDDMANIMTDHAAPAGERVCHAGESCHPTIPEGSGTWTMRSRAAVLHGPNRRTLFRPVDWPRACYEKPPYLILGEGVEMKPEWRQGTRSIPTPVGPDDDMEAYRQYEFDHPDTYPQ